MPTTPPRRRALRVVAWLEKAGALGCSYRPPSRELIIDRIAEEFAEALEELREGFMRKTTKQEAKVHGGQGRP